MIKLVHLSDLHISSNEDENHIRLREKLIESVKENGKNADAVVFTGDLVDRHDSKAFAKGVEFLRNLMKEVQLPLEKLVIVPGNHDMKRDSMTEKILQGSGFQTDDSCKECWEYLKLRMSEYHRFAQKIQEFGNADNLYGYGIKILEKEGKKIIFNLLNSAWTNQGKQDYGNLYIGRWQLEQNCGAIKECKTEKDLVITLMHHPLSWLRDDERDMLRDYMLSEDKLDSPILLHGHVHKTELLAEENPRGKIVSLISGIGYPKAEEREAGQHKVSECKFAIYEIDEDNGNVDCFCLTSTETADFVADLSLYSGSKDGHYIMNWRKLQDEKVEERMQLDLDPVPVTSCWSGRKEELELLEKQGMNVIAISGVGGQGKTALAAEFYRRDIERNGKYAKHIWVDCRELQDTMHIKLLQLLEAITGGKEAVALYQDEQLKDTIKRFYHHAKTEKLLIVFDNVDAYVNLGSDELVNELRELVDNVLMQQNNSLIILTCRIPIYDSRANFRSIKLEGFKEPEGIEYFQMRGVKVEDEENEMACKSIIRITKGHPWWIGLIVGQIIAEKTSPKEYLDDNKEGLLANGAKVQQYFSAIWEKLGEDKNGENAQKIVRYLVESARPLSVDNICFLTGIENNKIYKAVRLLKGINLLIEHDNKGEEKKFQIHPLVREFVHENYSAEEQKWYVHQLLVLFIGRRVYEIVFQNRAEQSQECISRCDTESLIDAIETCLNARNGSEALALMSYSFRTLCDDGCHAQFLQLGERILNEIDWEKEEVTLIKERAAFLAEYIDTLSLQEHKRDRVISLVNRYEQCCERNTLPYSGFLMMKSGVMWRMGNYEEAYRTITEYERMKEKKYDVWFKYKSSNTYGMILRDMGRIDEALEVFAKDYDSSEKYGNIARCYMLKKDYAKAVEQMKQCLFVLGKQSMLENLINRGYAYYWIAEIYEAQGELEKAKIFLIMCLEVWQEYAPVLMNSTVALFQRLGEVAVDMYPGCAEKAVSEFLDS